MKIFNFPNLEHLERLQFPTYQVFKYSINSRVEVLDSWEDNVLHRLEAVR